MAAQEEATGDGACDGRLVLNAKLDFKGSEDLLKTLLTLRGEALTVDGSVVELLGSHAVQTLVIAARSWAADGLPFGIVDLSESAEGQLAEMGLDASVFTNEGTAA